jgi:hypothetical protein
MKAGLAVLWILTLAAAFGLGTLAASEWGGGGSANSFRKALDETDPIMRSLRLSAFLRELGPEDLPEVLETLDAKAVVGVSEEELKLLMLAWTRFDAPGAFDWASRQQRAGWPTLAPTAAMFAWGLRDPAAARVALDELEEGEFKRRLEESLVSGWIRSDDKRGVSDYLMSLPTSDRRQLWTNWLMKELLEDGVEAVIAWADAIPEEAPGRFKQVAFRTAANAVASADAQRAASWYDANRERDYVSASGALRVIARRWGAYHDPQALLEWLLGLPPSRQRETAMKSGIAAWLNRAPVEAQTWLRAAPRTPALDPALEHVAQTQIATSPSEAAEWVVRIQDDERRRALLMRVGARWGRRDSAGMEAWVAESKLSEEDRALMISPASRRAARPPVQVSDESGPQDVPGGMLKRARMRATRREQLRSAGEADPEAAEPSPPSRE